MLFLNFSETVLLVVPWFVLPACASIAILRYRLYDIDLVINRTLVYGALSAGIIGLYVLVVGGLGTLFQSSGNLALALLATGLAALLDQPLQASLQRRVNRLMYGEPELVLSRLSQQLKTSLAPATVLPGIAETVSQTLKLPYVAITVGYQRASLGIMIDAPEHLPALPAAVEVAVYRIVQEAVTNVVRHANAQHCVVRLHIDTGLRVEVLDDGCGLPTTRRSGVGLSSIRERTTDLGGTLTIEAAAGQGTQLRVWLPLARERP